MAQPIESDSRTWISRKSGLLIQIDSSVSSIHIKSISRVRYSRYDDASIRVDAPN